MILDLRGPRILLRSYRLPERIGSIWVPEFYNGGYDGTLWEVEQSSTAFCNLLTPVGMIGPKIIPALRTFRKRSKDSDEPPLILEPDDIIQTKGIFRGIYAGPELEREKGYACWFLDATETVTRLGEVVTRPSIEWVWPAKSWSGGRECRLRREVLHEVQHLQRIV